MVGSGDGVGSNAWVVDGDHSTTGEPILANDPHLAPTVPGVWYQMGLHCNELSDECPFDVSGFTFAGFPGVIIGHNQQIAWGFTNLGPDVTDLYLEAVDGERYLRGREWREFKRREETIRIAGEEPFTFTVRTSVHGPLLSDVSPTYASVGANAPVEGRVARPRPPATPSRWRGPRCAARAPPRRSSRSTARPTGRSSARRRGSSPPRARTWCTPTGTATSATRHPGSSRSGRRATPVTTRLPAGTPPTTGPATSSRSRRSRRCSTRRRGSSPRRTRRRSAGATPTTWAARGTRGTAASGSSTC